MKKKLTILGVSLIALAALVPSTLVFAGTGNGVPSGAHYNLNILGVPKDKTADLTGDNRHRTFVDLVGNTKINLLEGPSTKIQSDFQVLDAKGTDGVAAFQLPNPAPDGDGVTAYSVYACALGKPGGTSTTTTCFDETISGVTTTFCSTESLVLVRSTGKSTFYNVSKELLTVCLSSSRSGLFSNPSASYFWDYTNDGLKLAQLRFYEVPTTVGTTC